ncbi:CLUMA_CG020877, isoform A, partial [Clunio marinus]
MKFKKPNNFYHTIPSDTIMLKRQRNMRKYFIVSVVAILCYVNSLSGDFVHDDLPAIVYNNDVLGTASIADLMVNDFWGVRMKLKESHKSYRPLTTLTFRLNKYFFGIDSAFWFHVVNVFLHGLSSILFTRICSRVARFKSNFSLIAGIFFAVHPIHTESVSGIVGRAELLGCTFFSLSFLFYHGQILKIWIVYLRKKNSITIRNHRFSDPDGQSLWLSIILGGLAMLAKESGLTVFIVNLIYDFYRNWSTLKKTVQDVRWSNESYRFAKRTFSVSVSMTILLLARISLLQGSLPRFSQQDNPAAFHSSLQTRILTFFYLSSFNLWLLICPSTLSHDWQMGSIPLILSFRDSRNLLTIVTISAIFGLIYKILCELELRRHPPIVLGFILLVLPFILPASNLLVTVGFVIAERILFIPSMGFCILVIYGVQLLYENMKKLRRIIKVSGCILVIVFCMKTLTRNQDWLTRESLLRSGLKVLPNNAKLHYNYANFLRDTLNLNQAKMHYKKALQLWPSYASAWNNLGTLIDDDIGTQEQHFLSAIKFSHQHINAHFNLGQLYRKTNKTLIAVRMFEKCIRIDKNFIPAYLGLSKIQTGISSGILLRKALELNKKSTIVRLEYADWLYANRLYIEAMKHYKLGIFQDESFQASFIV